MTLRGAWARVTTPVGGDAAQRRAQAVQLNVLAGFVVLLVLTQLTQIARLVLAPSGAQALWWGVDVLVLALAAWLIVLTRTGRARPAAWALVIVLGLLVVALVLTDGVDEPMWAAVTCLQAIVAVVLLGPRPAVVLFTITAVAVLALSVLLALDLLEPLLPFVAKEGIDVAGAIGVVVALGFSAAVCWIVQHHLQALSSPAGEAQSPPAPRRVRTVELSARELDVVRLVAEGLSNDAIAERLVVSPRTVQSHVAKAMKKTESGNRTELGVLALREGLVPLEVSAE